MEPNNVFKRPNSNDSEADLIKFQKLFLSEKSKNTSFQPAAKVIRLTNQEENPEASTSPKVSQFAKKRGLQKEDGSVSSKPQPKLILGEVIEKLDESQSQFDRVSDSNEAFPKACRIDRSKIKKSDGTKSLFAISQSNSSAAPTINAVHHINFGDVSSMVTESDAKAIHDENVQLLSGMNEADILAERKELLDTIDPDLLRFIQSKRKGTKANTVTPKIETEANPTINADLSSIDLLSHPNIHTWPHFDVVESEKLEWMKDIANNLPKLKPGQSYEARFDWKGVLLPYFTPETDGDRELFLHETDAQRPGYTLQELFRLARSNVVQQRNSAIGAICGILNIYNQGFYDKVLEVPISKIFFLLRFAFDDNTPILLETSSKALATLFYNDSDEILLDCTHECATNFREPTLGTGSVKRKDGDLSDQFAKMNVKEKQTFHNVFDDDEEDTSTLNDFHLAEVDLIECLLRTNILQRIQYVLFVVRNDNSTVVSCFKILIRLARTDRAVAEKIFRNRELLDNCVREFLPNAERTTNKMQFYQRPQFLFLKLLRVIAAHELPVWELDVEDALKSYIFMKGDMSMDFIKLQIESFRLMKTICLLRKTNELCSELIPAYQYLLEWHYNFLQFDQLGGHSIIRQHGAALISLIGCKSFSCATDAFPNRLNQCISKWFYAATHHIVQDFSQIVLLATSLQSLSRLQGYDHSEFIRRFVIPFLRSDSFKKMCNDLCQSSLLLSSTTQRTYKTESLPDLDSVQFQNDSPVLIVGEKYPIYVLNGIIAMLDCMTVRKDETIVNHLMTSCMNDILYAYLKRLCNGFNVNIRKNWFVRNELAFVVNLLRLKHIPEAVDKATIQRIAFNVMRCCTENELEDLLFILKNIVFNVARYDNAADVFQSDMDVWYRSYLLQLGPIVQQTNSLVHVTQKDFLIPNDWFWQPLLIFLNNDQRTDGNALTKHTFIASLAEKDIIQMTIRLTTLQKRNSLNFITPTEELMFLMISFMGPTTAFLEPDISQLLGDCIQQFFKDNKDTTFTFDEKFDGKSKFENLYVAFLDHFQGTSYGNELFSALVMVPLAQKYDAKWRKMVWSEHAVVLRFITCRENQCIGTIDDYLYPVESDTSLLKCYFQAMNGVLREGSLPYTIAKHHLDQNRIPAKK
ncbi:hypothetical protein HA402_013531 [Bradysia odoriphaga]|nr:hypothetical protein HA402_013531 [Bradysia odoriphaga]